MTSNLRPTTVYLGLGSNIGDKKRNIRKAIGLLDAQEEIKIIKTSSFYRTSPVGPKQPDFINAAVTIQTTLEPLELLYKVKEIESALGRKRTFRRGPRMIDLDILFYGKKELKTKNLVLPHPMLAARRFVLEPLAELAPGFVHPVLKKTIKKLRENALTFEGQKVKII